MLNIDISALRDALKRNNSILNDSTAHSLAEKLITQLDPRLEQNLKEWVEGRAISDLWIGKYCVNAIMHIRNDKDFLSALDAMNLYLQDERAGVRAIWRSKK